MREKITEFLVEWAARCFVMGKHQRWSVPAAITFAIVNVLPEPVTPSSVWNCSLFSSPSVNCLIATGCEPSGANVEASWNSVMVVKEFRVIYNK